MTELVPSGIDEIGLAPGSHVCAFYRGDRDRDRILSGYLAAGLAAGDKCVCVIDSARTAESLRTLLAGKAPEPLDDQLEIYLPETTYLAGGEFTTGDMLTFWTENLANAETAGYSFCRMAGEMTWALRGVPGTEHLAGYESELNRLTESHPVTVLCLYDLDLFGGDTVVNTIKTHPQVLVQGILVDNPYYVGPDEFLASFRPCAPGKPPGAPDPDAQQSQAPPQDTDASAVTAVLRSAGL